MCDACRVRGRSLPGPAGAPAAVRPRDAPPYAAGLLGRGPEVPKGKTNPKTDKEFTDAETVRGFHDRATGQIHAHETRGDSGTIVHESMHLFGSKEFLEAVGFNPNEGTTEVFARKLCEANSIPRAGYRDQFKSVKKVVALTSETLLADAYFNGKLKPIEDEIDAAKGKGTWAKWLAFMTAAKFADADALL
jgi:hypothetical protein